MPKGIPITEEDLQKKREEIFKATMHLFVEKGFNETSMREIGKTAGLGKSTLYDYFSTKDEILIFFVEKEVRLFSEIAGKVMDEDISASAKLHRILGGQLDHQLANRQLYLRLSFETQRLNFESQRKIQVLRHNYQDMLRRIVDEGIRSGEFRPVNSLLVIRGMLALLSSAIFTTRPTGAPGEMLDEAFDILFQGIEVR